MVTQLRLTLQSGEWPNQGAPTAASRRVGRRRPRARVREHAERTPDRRALRAARLLRRARGLGARAASRLGRGRRAAERRGAPSPAAGRRSAGTRQGIPRGAQRAWRSPSSTSASRRRPCWRRSATASPPRMRTAVSCRTKAALQWIASAEDDLDRILWEIGRATGRLVVSPRLGRIRACAASDCGWWFVDDTKNRSRRWCDMKICGNREKIRRFRSAIVPGVPNGSKRFQRHCSVGFRFSSSYSEPL